jgi:hypothetical protein
MAGYKPAPMRSEERISYSSDHESVDEKELDLDFSTFMTGFAEDIKGYVLAQRRSITLSAAYKLAVLLGKAVQRLSVIAGLGAALLFMGIALALYLGELLTSYPIGFLLAGGLIAVLVGVFNFWWSHGGRDGYILARINDMNDDEDAV